MNGTSPATGSQSAAADILTATGCLASAGKPSQNGFPHDTSLACLPSQGSLSIYNMSKHAASSMVFSNEAGLNAVLQKFAHDVLT